MSTTAPTQFSRGAARFFALASLTLALAGVLRAQTVWTNPDMGDWAAAGNWDNGVPDEFTTATINGGTATLTGPGAADYFNLGSSGPGGLVVNGGDFLASSSLYLGVYSGGHATLSLASGSFAGSGQAYVGAFDGGEAVVTVTGGTFSAGGQLYLGSDGGTGSLAVSGGTVSTGTQALIGSGGTGTLTVTGGTFSAGTQLYVGSEGTGSLAIDGGAVTAGTQAYVGVFGGTGTLSLTAGTFSTAEDLFVGAFSGSDGEATVTAGTLSVGTQLNVGYNGGTGSFAIDGGAVTVGAQAKIGTSGGSGTLAMTAGTFAVGTRLFVGSGGTGGFTLGGGAVTVTNQTYVGDGGTGTLAITGGSFSAGNQLYIGAFDGANGSVTISGGSLSVNQSLYLAYGGTGTLTIDGGAVSAGNNRINIANISSSTGTLNLNGGILSTVGIDGGGAVGNGSINFNGGTLRATVSNAQFLRFFNPGKVQIAAGGATIDTQAFNIGTATVLQGVGGLVKQGSGTLTLSGDSTYTGATVVNGGSLVANTLANGGLASAIGASSSNAASLVLDGATLRYGGSGSATTDRLFSIGTGGATLALDYDSATLTLTNPGTLGFNGQTGARQLTLGGGGQGLLAAVIGDNGGPTSLAKSGSGVWTLTGSSTYTGETNVGVGTLQVDGSIATSSLTTVQSWGTLSGTGTVGALTIASGGTVAPGNSPGTLSAGDTTFGSGGRFLWEINSVDGTAGSGVGWDLLSISGALNIAATAGSPFTISLVSLDLFNGAGELGNFNDSSTYYFVFASTTDGVSGFSADKFVIDTEGFQNAFTGNWSVELIGNDLNLVYTAAASAVPEPSTYAAIAGAAMLGFALWRRRRGVSA
jgi:autotransporter-associated beta strand protein/T5SS/PEP-CTERM-associated repeat protein